MIKILQGDCREVLKTLSDASVHCCVTSPPYFGLRDYGCDGQIGLESTPDAYVAELVAVFREVRRVLRDDGVLFLNLGDSYFGSGKGGNPEDSPHKKQQTNRGSVTVGYAPKYGICDKAKQGSPNRDLSSESQNDGRTDSWLNRISDTDCRHAHEQAAELFPRILASMEELRGRLPIVDSDARQQIRQSLTAMRDQASFSIHAVERLLSFLESTPVGCAPQLPGGLTPKDMLLAFLSSLQTFSACVLRCVGTPVGSEENEHGTAGSVLLFAELAHHIRCTSGLCSIVSSWLNAPYVQAQCTTTGGYCQALKPKDLIGIPWRVAFALQADGWYLRQDIIWHKPNPMPESVRDRCTKAHEYIFLLAKSPRYYYDADAVAEPVAPASIQRLSQDVESQQGSSRVPGKTNGPMRAVGRGGRNAFRGQGHFRDGENGPANREGRDMKDVGAGEATRNRRSVWTVTTKPYREAHFATFPPDLITPCIRAGCPAGGTVLDPFGGSGTTGEVAASEGRNAILIELNPAYIELEKKRGGLFVGASA